MSEKQRHSEDEINFSGLKSFAFAVLQEFFHFVEFTRVVVRKKLIFLIIGAILGIGLALLYHYKKQQFYTASMVVIFNKLTAKSYGKVVENLNSVVAAGQIELLAKQLQIPVAVASLIIYIDSRNMNDQPLAQDTSSKIFQLFKINLRLASPTNVDTIQSGLLNYFANLPYLKAMTDVERKYHQERLRAIDSDLAKLDSLKSTFNQFLSDSKMPSTTYNNGVNPATIYEQSTLLINQRETIQRLLHVENRPVSLVDGFKLVPAPRARPLPELMLILGSVGLFTGFLFGLLMETKKQVLPQRSI